MSHDIADYIWNGENLRRYREKLERGCPPEEEALWGMSCMLFYVDPPGTLAQCEDLVELVVSYARSGRLSDRLVSEVLLGRGRPIFRVDCMAETAPLSGEFRPVRFDLIEKAVKNRDCALLKRLLPYIDLSAFEEFREEIAALTASD